MLSAFPLRWGHLGPSQMFLLGRWKVSTKDHPGHLHEPLKGAGRYFVLGMGWWDQSLAAVPRQPPH